MREACASLGLLPRYLFSEKSQPLQLVYMPPAIPNERFFTRLTTRVGLPHNGHDGVIAASTFFARSAVFALGSAMNFHSLSF